MASKPAGRDSQEEKKALVRHFHRKGAYVHGVPQTGQNAMLGLLDIIKSLLLNRMKSRMQGGLPKTLSRVQNAVLSS